MAWRVRVNTAWHFEESVVLTFVSRIIIVLPVCVTSAPVGTCLTLPATMRALLSIQWTSCIQITYIARITRNYTRSAEGHHYFNEQHTPRGKTADYY